MLKTKIGNEKKAATTNRTNTQAIQRVHQCTRYGLYVYISHVDVCAVQMKFSLYSVDESENRMNG